MKKMYLSLICKQIRQEDVRTLALAHAQAHKEGESGELYLMSSR